MKNLLLVFALCLPLRALADGGLPSQPYIYVHGIAQMQRLPDLAVLQFTFQTRDRNQAEANKQMQGRVNKLFALLDQFKIAQDDVDATDIRSAAEYDNKDQSQPQRGEVTGFTVTRNFAVTVKQLSVFPKLIDAILEGGVEQFGELSLRFADENAFQGELREKALANAREQAEKTLKAEHMKVDSVFAVSPVPFASIRSDLFGDASSSSSRLSVMHEQIDPTQYRVQPLTRGDMVHVIYLISPAR